MTSVLSAKHFHDEAAAYAFVEARIWPEGPVCPHCGGTERISKMNGKSTRLGSLQVLPVPQAVPRDRWDRLRIKPRYAAYLAASDRAAVVFEKGHQQQPASPHSWASP